MELSNSTSITVAASQSKWNKLAQEDTLTAIWCPKGGMNPDWDSAAQECLEVILKDIPVSKDWRVLDLGCGIGRLTKLMAPRCLEVFGVDFSVEMIQRAKSYLSSVENAHLFLNNGFDLKGFSDATFDFIYSMITLQHIPSRIVIENYIAEITRTLKPGGLTRLQTCYGDSFSLGPISPTLYHGHMHSYEFEQILQNTGLSIVKTEIGCLCSDWIWVTAKRV